MSFSVFCREYSGVTGQAAKRAANNRGHGTKPMRDIFFQPYQFSKPCNPFFRAATVVTAPICLSILALNMAAAIVANLCKSILSLAKMDLKKSRFHLELSGCYIYPMCIHLLAAAISPVVNLVDLVGGGVATAATCCPSF